MTEQIDGLAALTEVLAIKRSGWHRIEGPDGVALFPETAKDVDAWEQRALAMTAAQAPIHLAPKPVENTLAARVVRAD